MSIWIFLLGFIFGGVVYPLILMCLGTSGTIRIDRSNPDKDVYRLELDSLESLPRMKRIILKVDSHADLSQK